jgi:exonuclease SbcC
MIQSIHLKNFQAHRNTFVELSEGVNIITGASDNGKSAILRAFLWVILNRPLGDDVKNWYMDDSETTEVQIVLKNGTIITKSKRKDSIYTIKTPTGLNRRDGQRYKEKRFEAFKQDVPDEIQEAFNMNDINIQDQHKPYFMISDSSGDVAKKFNQLAGLDIIDRMFKNLNKFILEDSRNIDRGSEASKTLEKEIEALSFVDDAKKDVEKYTSLERQKRIVDAEQSSLKKANNTLIGLEKLKEEIRGIFTIEEDLKVLSSLVNIHEEAESKNAVLKSILSRLNKTEEEVRDDEEWFSLETPLSVISGLLAEYKTLKSEANNLSSLLLNLNTTQKELEDSELKAKSLEEDFSSFLEIHKVCPLCGNKISKTCINKILL